MAREPVVGGGRVRDRDAHRGADVRGGLAPPAHLRRHRAEHHRISSRHAQQPHGRALQAGEGIHGDAARPSRHPERRGRRHLPVMGVLQAPGRQSRAAESHPPDRADVAAARSRDDEARLADDLRHDQREERGEGLHGRAGEVLFHAADRHGVCGPAVLRRAGGSRANASPRCATRSQKWLSIPSSWPRRTR